MNTELKKLQDNAKIVIKTVDPISIRINAVVEKNSAIAPVAEYLNAVRSVAECICTQSPTVNVNLAQLFNAMKTAAGCTFDAKDKTVLVSCACPEILDDLKALITAGASVLGLSKSYVKFAPKANSSAVTPLPAPSAKKEKDPLGVMVRCVGLKTKGDMVALLIQHKIITAEQIQAKADVWVPLTEYLKIGVLVSAGIKVGKSHQCTVDGTYPFKKDEKSFHSAKKSVPKKDN